MEPKILDCIAHYPCKPVYTEAGDCGRGGQLLAQGWQVVGGQLGGTGGTGTGADGQAIIR